MGASEESYHPKSKHVSVNFFIILDKIKSEINFILLRYLIGCNHHLPVFRDFRQRAARSWRYGWNALLIILEILDSYRSFLSLPKYQPVGQKPGLVGQIIFPSTLKTAIFPLNYYPSLFYTVEPITCPFFVWITKVSQKFRYFQKWSSCKIMRFVLNAHFVSNAHFV